MNKLEELSGKTFIKNIVIVTVDTLIDDVRTYDRFLGIFGSEELADEFIEMYIDQHSDRHEDIDDPDMKGWVMLYSNEFDEETSIACHFVTNFFEYIPKNKDEVETWVKYLAPEL